MGIEQGAVFQDQQGRKYVFINSNPHKGMVVYLKPDGSYPCAGERNDTYTSCNCGFPHKPCSRTLAQ